MTKKVNKQKYFSVITKNSNQTGEFRIWNFQEYQRNSIWNVQELIRNEVEFPRVNKKKQCGISMGLSFWPWTQWA